MNHGSETTGLRAPGARSVLGGAMAAGLTVLALAVGCQATEPDMEQVDLLLVGGRLVGGPSEVPPSWLAVDSGRIVGSGEGGSSPFRSSRQVALAGRVLAPAFVDHHAHLLNIGMSVMNRSANEAWFLDLSSAGSIEAIAEAVAGRAATRPADEWILGKGWSQGAWGLGELPDRGSLDLASPHHAVLLTRVDAHAGWVNGEALRRAGLDRDTPDPPGGEIRRRADGEPSGVLLERAIEPLVPLLPSLDAESIKEAFARGAATLVAQGVTEVFDAGFLAPPGIVALNVEQRRLLDALVAVDSASGLPLRIWLMIPAPSRLAEEVLAKPETYRRLSPNVGVSHLKLFADGAMGSRGASLSHTFADDPTTDGVVRMSESEIFDWSDRAVEAGLDVATHAIGDAAVHRTLGAYARLLEKLPDLDPARLRVEHFSYASAADRQRASELGVVLSIQPNFVLPDDDGLTMEDARLGERSALAYPWGRLARSGARLAGGSDYFTVPFTPLFSFHAAATRTNQRALPPAGWHPQDRLTREQAWQLFTGLHAPGGGPPRRRVLATGEVADLVILSADPLQVEEAEIPKIQVHATLREGRTVFHDGSLPHLEALP